MAVKFVVGEMAAAVAGRLRWSGLLHWPLASGGLLPVSG